MSVLFEFADSVGTDCIMLCPLWEPTQLWDRLQYVIQELKVYFYCGPISSCIFMPLHIFGNVESNRVISNVEFKIAFVVVIIILMSISSHHT